MKQGDIVKYSKPVDDKEAEIRFKVLEDRGDRVLVELITDQFNLKPTFCYSTNEFELA